MISWAQEIINLLVVGRRHLHFFPNNELCGDGKAGGAVNCWWFGCNVKLGKGGGMILEAIRMVKRGRCYAVNSKHSIDFKTQFVAHVLIFEHHSAKTSFYQQIISLVLEITNLLVVGGRRWHYFPNNEFSGSGNGNAGGAANCW